MIICGAAFAGLSVILGAFGAHALKARLTPEQIQVFQTGVSYQFYHSLALILTGILMQRIPAPMLSYAGSSFILGILFFSGSLYLLSTASINGLENFKRVLGPVTPLGGLAFIAGWVMMVLGIIKSDL